MSIYFDTTHESKPPYGDPSGRSASLFVYIDAYTGFETTGGGICTAVASGKDAAISVLKAK